MQPQTREGKGQREPEDLTWCLPETDNPYQELVNITDVIDADLLTPDNIRSFLSYLLTHPNLGPWGTQSPQKGAQWLQDARNQSQMARIIRIGFEMHHHEMVDFHGWAGQMVDGAFSFVLIRELLTLDREGYGQGQEQDTLWLEDQEISGDGDDPQDGDGGGGDSGGNATYKGYEDCPNDGDKESNDPDWCNTDYDYKDDEDEDDDESNMSGGSKIIDGCLPTLYLNSDELTQPLTSGFLSSVATQAGVDRVEMMITMAPWMLMGERRY